MKCKECDYFDGEHYCRRVSQYTEQQWRCASGIEVEAAKLKHDIESKVSRQCPIEETPGGKAILNSTFGMSADELLQQEVIRQGVMKPLDDAVMKLGESIEKLKIGIHADESDELLGNYEIAPDGEVIDTRPTTIRSMVWKTLGPFEKGTGISDPVNHPSHYTDGNIEVIDYIEDKKLPYHLGNAVKYISRAGKKDAAKTIEDLKKADWYINRYIELLSK